MTEFIIGNPIIMLIALYLGVKLIKKLIRKVIKIFILCSVGIPLITSIIGYVQNFLDNLF